MKVSGFSASAFLKAHPKVDGLGYLGMIEDARQQDIYDRHCLGAGSTFSVFLPALGPSLPSRPKPVEEEAAKPAQTQSAAASPPSAPAAASAPLGRSGG